MADLGNPNLGTTQRLNANILGLRKFWKSLDDKQKARMGGADRATLDALCRKGSSQQIDGLEETRKAERLDELGQVLRRLHQTYSAKSSPRYKLIERLLEQTQLEPADKEIPAGPQQSPFERDCRNGYVAGTPNRELASTGRTQSQWIEVMKMGAIGIVVVAIVVGIGSSLFSTRLNGEDPYGAPGASSGPAQATQTQTRHPPAQHQGAAEEPRTSTPTPPVPDDEQRRINELIGRDNLFDPEFRRDVRRRLIRPDLPGELPGLYVVPLSKDKDAEAYAGTALQIQTITFEERIAGEDGQLAQRGHYRARQGDPDTWEIEWQRAEEATGKSMRMRVYLIGPRFRGWTLQDTRLHSEKHWEWITAPNRDPARGTGQRERFWVRYLRESRGIRWRALRPGQREAETPLPHNAETRLIGDRGSPYGWYAYLICDDACEDHVKTVVTPPPQEIGILLVDGDVDEPYDWADITERAITDKARLDNLLWDEQMTIFECLREEGAEPELRAIDLKEGSDNRLPGYDVYVAGFPERCAQGAGVRLLSDLKLALVEVDAFWQHHETDHRSGADGGEQDGAKAQEDDPITAIKLRFEDEDGDAIRRDTLRGKLIVSFGEDHEATCRLTQGRVERDPAGTELSLDGDQVCGGAIAVDELTMDRNGTVAKSAKAAEAETISVRAEIDGYEPKTREVPVAELQDLIVLKLRPPESVAPSLRLRLLEAGDKPIPRSDLDGDLIIKGLDGIDSLACRLLNGKVTGADDTDVAFQPWCEGDIEDDVLRIDAERHIAEALEEDNANPIQLILALARFEVSSKENLDAAALEDEIRLELTRLHTLADLRFKPIYRLFDEDRPAFNIINEVRCRYQVRIAGDADGKPVVLRKDGADALRATGKGQDQTVTTGDRIVFTGEPQATCAFAEDVVVPGDGKEIKVPIRQADPWLLGVWTSAGFPEPEAAGIDHQQALRASKFNFWEQVLVTVNAAVAPPAAGSGQLNWNFVSIAEGSDFEGGFAPVSGAWSGHAIDSGITDFADQGAKRMMGLLPGQRHADAIPVVGIGAGGLGEEIRTFADRHYRLAGESENTVLWIQGQERVTSTDCADFKTLVSNLNRGGQRMRVLGFVPLTNIQNNLLLDDNDQQGGVATAGAATDQRGPVLTPYSNKNDHRGVVECNPERFGLHGSRLLFFRYKFNPLTESDNLKRPLAALEDALTALRSTAPPKQEE